MKTSNKSNKIMASGFGRAQTQKEELMYILWAHHCFGGPAHLELARQCASLYLALALALSLSLSLLIGLN